jgi:ketosteroid isomerase-like protein
MKPLVKLLLTILLITSMGGQTQTKAMKTQIISQSTLSSEEQRVLTLHKQLLAAVASKQEPLLKQHIRNEFVFISAFGESLNKKSFIEGFAMNPAIQLPVFISSDQQVTVLDEVAIVRALVQISIVQGKAAPNELWERITETYTKADGEWKLLASQATFTQANK